MSEWQAVGVSGEEETRSDAGRARPLWLAAAVLAITCVVPLVARFTGYEAGVLAILAVAATP